jgi:TolA-binding protein
MESIKDFLNDEHIDLFDSDAIEKKIQDARRKGGITLSDIKGLYALGEKFYKKFRFKEAEVIFASYSALVPHDHRGPGAIASIYLEQKKFQKALVVLQTLKTFPTADFDEVLTNIALCHYKLNELQNAAAMMVIIDKTRLNAFYTNRFGFLEQQLAPHLDGVVSNYKVSE